MPRTSQVLDSPHRATAETLILAGRPVKSIARELGMPYDSLRRYAARLRQGRQRPAVVEAEPLSTVQTYERAFGHPARPHQVEYLGETRSLLFLKGRQVGATDAGAGLAIHTARTYPGSDTVIISPSQRQSTEVTKRARTGFWELGEGLVQDSTTMLRLRNGSRVVSLPGNSRGIRGYAPLLVIIDEAAWVGDETWAAARPLVAASGGRIVVQSTPGARVGWFYDLASETPAGWAYMELRSDEAGTVSAEFLASERASMSPELYAQEYECQFGRSGGALFSPDRIASLILPDEGDGE